MSKTLGTVPLFASQSWRSSAQTNKASKRSSGENCASESILLQRLKPKASDHFEASPMASGHQSPASPDSPKYFSFPKVDGWSDYDSASSTHSLPPIEDTPAVKSLKNAQQVLIKQPPLPRPVLSWNLPPILQVPLRWVLGFKRHFWGHQPLQ